ncbi:hypothetical protein RDI58_019678 [Solanum bulbocastanum]|uniref:Uncharacterized protein n=1 Tax=Solanum bulbocastanum TaxID=147425 RepID=A0AAN8TBC6_SOLBU
MITIRDEVEHDIWWQVKAENSSFWFHNWIRQGAVYFLEEGTVRDEELEVKDFIINGEWDVQKLNLHFRGDGHVYHRVLSHTQIKSVLIRSGG